MDDHSTGRGVYVARRIVAVLVLLLALALLVPWAYQALLGQENESESGVSNTADVSSFGNDESHEEGASSQKTFGVVDDVEHEDDSGDLSYSGVRERAVMTSVSLGTSNDEHGGGESTGIDAALFGAAVFDDITVGEVDQTVPTPVVDASVHQPVQPILTAELAVPVDLAASSELLNIEEETIPQGAAYQDPPVYYQEEPAYYDYSLYYYEDPTHPHYPDFYSEYPTYYGSVYEEQIFTETYVLDSNYDAGVVTAGTQADGAVYAGTGVGSEAYAAVGTS